MLRRWSAAARLAYGIDGAFAGELSGWVFQRDRPFRRVWIVAEPDNGTPSFHLADLHRADVQRADLGSDGSCGFVVPIELGAVKSIVIRATDPTKVLGRWHDEKPVAPGKMRRIDDLLFRLDPPGSLLSGWLSSSASPFERRLLTLQVDGQAVDEQRACLLRRDAPPETLDGFHGFAIPIAGPCREARLYDKQSALLLHKFRR